MGTGQSEFPSRGGIRTLGGYYPGVGRRCTQMQGKKSLQELGRDQPNQ